jgi:hypothetical protein
MKSVKHHAWLIILFILSGCAGTDKLLGTEKRTVPPEFNQKVFLEVSDEYEMYQAPRSRYDIGDLQAFHSQHTLPSVIEGAFKEIFSQAQLVDSKAKIEMEQPNVPAIFEVRILDLAYDIYNEATTYRSQVVLGVAMKSPRGNIFWQQSFRGEGYTKVDPQFSTGLGPEQAILDGMRDAIAQMQNAILSSPQVRNQLKYYLDIERARREKEVTV